MLAFRKQSGSRSYFVRLISLDLQIVEIRNAGFHHWQIHFDEVILDAAGSRGSKDFLPIQSVLPHGHDLLGLRGPALHMHGNEAARVLREILGGIVAPADSGDLELKLNQLRIEQVE
jgi:hypothetical protein